ncbi:MAG TPA: polysaccharide biosynthesis/export family protein [Lentisphaeria bacterium]|nr:polysaccharide biosynthesis/export family protein [Lentisphaeria bacterium]
MSFFSTNCSRRRHAAIVLASALTVLACVSGCKKADEYPPLPPVASVADISVKSEEERARELAWLQSLHDQSYPIYRTHSGDVFTIKVYENPELEAQDVVVTPDGQIALMLVGTCNLLGKTLPEMVEELEKRYSEYIRNPKVAVIPRTINSQTATIAGKVNEPGMYPVNNRIRLADFLAMGNGTPTSIFNGQGFELADFSSSFIVRDGERLPVDFERVLEGDPLHNIHIHPGDYVYISSRANRLVGVMGEVHLPQFIVWYENMGLLEAVVRANGLKDEYWKNVIVIRGGMNDPILYRVNIDDVLHGKLPNPGLMPNDIVYVPKDAFSEYNVFIRKLFPTGQLLNMVLAPITFWSNRD